MTQTELNYAVVLYELPIEKESIQSAQECFKNVPMLKEVLANPTIDKKQKWNIIERVFPKEMYGFLKKVCELGHMSKIDQIFEAYTNYASEQESFICAELFYVTEPSEAQKDGFVNFIKKEYQCQNVKLQLVEDRSLLGGFLLKIGSVEYDYSLLGKLNHIRQQLIG